MKKSFLQWYLLINYANFWRENIRTFSSSFWRRKWQPTPEFLPGGSPWTEEPGGLQFRGHEETGLRDFMFTFLCFFQLKRKVWNVGDPGSIPGSGRSPGEGNGNPLQYSCLENPMDRGAGWAAIPGVMKSRTRLNDFIFTLIMNSLLPNSDLNWRKQGKPLDHSGMT